MQLKIQVVKDEGKEGGIIHVHKVAGAELKKIGEMKFSDELDRKWLMMALTEDHPNVSVIS